MQGLKKTGNYLLSRSLATTVPSTLEGLTSVFGMGTGVAPPESLPEKYFNNYVILEFAIPKKFIKGQAFGKLVLLSSKPIKLLHMQPINLVVFQVPSTPKCIDTLS